MAGEFEVTVQELDVIGDALGIDVRPFPFQFPIHGNDLDDRRRIIVEAHQSLTDRGLIDGASFVSEFEHVIALFARGRTAIAMLGEVGKHSYQVRAVIEDKAGVVAVQRSDTVRFTRIRPTSIVRVVLGMLPPMGPGPGSSITVRGTAAATPARSRDEDDLSSVSYLQMVRPPLTTADAQRAAAELILNRPRQGNGYFVVTTRGRNGKETDPATLSWVDTDAGRYMVIPSINAEGTLHATYAPADLGRLGQSLTRLVQAALNG